MALDSTNMKLKAGGGLRHLWYVYEGEFYDFCRVGEKKHLTKQVSFGIITFVTCASGGIGRLARFRF